MATSVSNLNISSTPLPKSWLDRLDFVVGAVRLVADSMQPHVCVQQQSRLIYGKAREITEGQRWTGASCSYVNDFIWV